MAINIFACGDTVADFLQNLGISVDSTVGIHQFCQTQNTLTAIIRCKFFCFQNRTRLIQIGRRNAGRQHKVDRKFQIPCRFQHEVESSRACYVGNLMRVCNDCRCAMRKDSLLKCRPTEHGAFDVNMTINQTRTDVFSVQIHFILAGIFSYTNDFPVMDGHIGLFDFVSKHIYNFCTFQYKLCIHFSLCSGDLLFQCFCLHKNLPHQNFSH